jgi:hypothetical protein
MNQKEQPESMHGSSFEIYELIRKSEMKRYNVGFKHTRRKGNTRGLDL